MTQQHFPILDQMTVKPATNGLVAVTVLLPPKLVREYRARLVASFDAFMTQGLDRQEAIKQACGRRSPRL